MGRDQISDIEAFGLARQEFELTLEAARDADLRQVMQPHAETTRTMAIELLSRVGSTDPENDATWLTGLASRARSTEPALSFSRSRLLPWREQL
ncbi:MAG: hypothetical protein P8J50_07520 [Acidimicrobiales bacterium]|nr:hypothetical protein [Acidimicrobiales bacterium]